MFRLHLYRIALTCVLMAAFIGGGLLFGQPGTTASMTGPTLTQKARPAAVTTTHAAVRATARDADDLNRRAVRPNPPQQLSWPFFSFGRKRSTSQ